MGEALLISQHRPCPSNGFGAALLRALDAREGALYPAGLSFPPI
jgi:hypothetical protein